MNAAYQINYFNLILGAFFAILIAAAAFRFQALTLSGAIGTVVTGTIIFGLGGLLFAIPLIFFFTSSVVFSRLKSERKKSAAEYGQKEGARDIRQVFANGGIGILCAITHFLTGNDLWFLVYLAGIAEASADTWATEIGMLSKSDPISIISFKKIESGLSGGITLLGTSASLAGAFLTALIGVFTFRLLSSTLESVSSIILVTGISGFSGALLDSFLGGSIQAQYRCLSCGRRTERREHCRRETEKVRGAGIVDNDLVNLISAIAAVLMALIMAA